MEENMQLGGMEENSFVQGITNNETSDSHSDDTSIEQVQIEYIEGPQGPAGIDGKNPSFDPYYNQIMQNVCISFTHGQEEFNNNIGLMISNQHILFLTHNETKMNNDSSRVFLHYNEKMELMRFERLHCVAYIKYCDYQCYLFEMNEPKDFYIHYGDKRKNEIETYLKVPHFNNTFGHINSNGFITHVHCNESCDLSGTQFFQLGLYLQYSKIQLDFEHSENAKLSSLMYNCYYITLGINEDHFNISQLSNFYGPYEGCIMKQHESDIPFELENSDILLSVQIIDNCEEYLRNFRITFDVQTMKNDLQVLLYLILQEGNLLKITYRSHENYNIVQHKTIQL